jgi:hypothetical protein
VLLTQTVDGTLAVIEADGSALKVTWPQRTSPGEATIASAAPIIAVSRSNRTVDILRLTETTLSALGTIDAGAPELTTRARSAGRAVDLCHREIGCSPECLADRRSWSK